MLSQGQVRIANSSSLDTTGSTEAPHALGSLLTLIFNYDSTWINSFTNLFFNRIRFGFIFCNFDGFCSCTIKELMLK